MPKRPSEWATRGRRGGRATSDKKSAASRRNGALGGRPAKFEPGDRVSVKKTASSAQRGRTGVIDRPGDLARSYVVRFDDGVEPVIATLRSWWIQRSSSKEPES